MTKISNFRLDEGTLDELDQIAILIGCTRTGALRLAVSFFRSSFVPVNLPVAPAVPDWSPRNVPSSVGDWS